MVNFERVDLMQGYNGWRNRETWLVNVHFGDNWESAEDVEYTQEYIDDVIEDLPSWVQDFIDIGCIDWDSLKKHFEEE